MNFMKKYFLMILMTLYTIDNYSQTYGTLADSRDNKTYKIVQIGTQWWMAENLNFKTTYSWCYQNDSANCGVYGRLYTLKSAESACPSNWHLPSESEWKILIKYLGKNEGGKMKEEGNNHWFNINLKATNESGFSGLPGGIYNFYVKDIFFGLGSDGYWWSSTVRHSSNMVINSICNEKCAIGYKLYYYSSKISKEDVCQESGLSVRCVKD